MKSQLCSLVALFCLFLTSEKSEAQKLTTPSGGSLFIDEEETPTVPLGSEPTRSWLFGADIGDSYAVSRLYRVDPRNVSVTEVGQIGRSSIFDIAFLADGRLYATQSRSPETDLIYINPRTAIGTWIGSIPFDKVNALVSDKSYRKLLGATTEGEFLRIDPTTASADFIGFYGSGLGSAGDLAWDDQGTLYGLAFTGGDCCNPAVLIRINPETGTATQIGQGVGFDNIFGLTFQSSATLLPGTSGTVLDPPKLLAVADGDLGETPKLIEIDRQTGQGTLLGSLNTFNGMAGLAANIRLTATRGRLRSFTFDERDGGNECNNVDSSWTYCQHKNGVTHGPGTNVDDTYAWDVNLSQLGDDNADRSKPVYSASPGRIVSFYGAIGPGEGLYNSVLIEHCFVPGPCDCALSPSECWWSRYLHMAEVFVFEGQEVGTEEVIGTIGSVGANNDHLHFAVYEGENRRDATGQGLLVSVDARLVTRAAIFIDGFESGDTSAWSARVP